MTGDEQNPFGLEGADAQRAQLEVLSQGMDEVEPGSPESRALLGKNAREFRGEKPVANEDVIREIQRRFEAGELSEEEQAQARPVVEEYIRSLQAAPQQAAPQQAAPQEAPVEAPQAAPEATTIEEGAAGALASFGVDPVVADTFVQNPAGRFLAGVGRNVSEHVQGVKQLYREATGDLEGAKQIAEQETRAAKQWEEFDQGLGAEDVGEATMMAASLLIPGGIEGKAAMKVGQSVLGKLAQTTGGLSVASGLAEATKVTEEDENRWAEGLKTAGLTFVGGHGLGAASKVLSGSATNGFIARAMGLSAASRLAGNSARGEVTRGIGRRVVSMFLGRKPTAGLATESRRALAAGNAAQNKLIAKGAESRAAGAQGPIGNQEWKEYVDLVQGFRAAARTQTKRAKELGIKRADDAQAIKASLLNGSFKTTDDGLTVIDGAEVAKRWSMLKAQPRFNELFGAGKTGKSIKALDEFVERIASGPQRPNGEIIYDLAAERIKANTQKVVDQIEGSKLPAPQKEQLIVNVRKAATARALAVVQDSGLDSEEVLQSFQQEDGMFNILDFWGTLDEKLAEAQ